MQTLTYALVAIVFAGIAIVAFREALEMPADHDTYEVIFASACAFIGLVMSVGAVECVMLAIQAASPVL